MSSENTADNDQSPSTELTADDNLEQLPADCELDC